MSVIVESAYLNSFVDETDLRIIGALQVNGRRSIADVSRELSIPKSTVKRRLDALVRNRVIMIAVYVDSAKLGLPIHVHLNLKIDLAQYPEAISEIVSLIEVRWVATTTGPADIVAEGFFASPDHLHAFIRDKLSRIDGISSVQTSVILSLEKFTFHWDEMHREAARHAMAHIPLSKHSRLKPISAITDFESSECSGQSGG